MTSNEHWHVSCVCKCQDVVNGSWYYPLMALHHGSWIPPASCRHLSNSNQQLLCRFAPCSMSDDGFLTTDHGSWQIWNHILLWPLIPVTMVAMIFSKNEPPGTFCLLEHYLSSFLPLEEIANITLVPSSVFSPSERLLKSPCYFFPLYWHPGCLIGIPGFL